MRVALQSGGYRVLETGDARQACTILEEFREPIHLLLTDVVMPNMSGKELAARSATLHPESRVLYMSGYTDNAIVVHGVLEATASFLQKPFAPKTLLKKVREVLDRGQPAAGESQGIEGLCRLGVKMRAEGSLTVSWKSLETSIAASRSLRPPRSQPPP